LTPDACVNRLWSAIDAEDESFFFVFDVPYRFPSLPAESRYQAKFQICYSEIATVDSSDIQ
jgi:hypothetical protein